MSAEDRLRDMMQAARTESRATDAEWQGFVRGARRHLYSRRVAAVAGAAALVVVGAFAAIALTSGDDPTPRPNPPAGTPTEAPSPSPSPEPTGPATVSVDDTEQEQWFVLDEKLWWGTTAMGGEIPADLASDDPVAQRAAFWLKTLLAVVPGPVAEEGGSTAIPEGTELLHVSRDGHVLEVDLSSEFESGGGSLSMQLRVAQIVYTGTQFEGIDAVRILIEGERVDAIGGEGVVVSEPLTRRDFQDFAPPIVVESPKPGDEVSSGFEISGFANVFEANVNIRLFDYKGKKLVETFTTATCGTGCWGDFAERVEFTVDERQEGRLEVLTFSAEDGSEQDLISIPVTLVP